MAIEFRCQLCRAWNSASRAICRECGRELPRHGRLYRVEVRRPDGRKVRRSVGRTGTIELARQLEYELRREVKQAKDDEPTELTWGKLTRQYLEKLEVEKKRPEIYRHYFRNAPWGDCPISEITPEQIRKWQTDLRRTLAPATCDRYLQICRAAWNAIVGDNNPFRKVKFFNPDNRVTRWLTPEERTRLLEAARLYNSRWYQWIIIALGTGLRRENVLRLERGHIDWNTNMIRVIQKGGREYVGPLSPGVAAVLRSIPPNGTKFYWINQKTGRPYRFIYHMWVRIKKLAGIDPKFRWHDLRHDFGSHIYAATKDLKAAQEALGHASIITTQRYAHLFPENLRAAIEAVDPLAHFTAHLVKKNE